MGCQVEGFGAAYVRHALVGGSLEDGVVDWKNIQVLMLVRINIVHHLAQACLLSFPILLLSLLYARERVGPIGGPLYVPPICEVIAVAVNANVPLPALAFRVPYSQYPFSSTRSLQLCS